MKSHRFLASAAAAAILAFASPASAQQQPNAVFRGNTQILVQPQQAQAAPETTTVINRGNFSGKVGVAANWNLNLSGWTAGTGSLDKPLPAGLSLSLASGPRITGTPAGTAAFHDQYVGTFTSGNGAVFEVSFALRIAGQQAFTSTFVDPPLTRVRFGEPFVINGPAWNESMAIGGVTIGPVTPSTVTFDPVLKQFSGHTHGAVTMQVGDLAQTRQVTARITLFNMSLKNRGLQFGVFETGQQVTMPAAVPVEPRGPVTWSLAPTSQPLPSGWTLNAQTGEYSGIVPAGQSPATGAIVVRATDLYGHADTTVAPVTGRTGVTPSPNPDLPNLFVGPAGQGFASQVISLTGMTNPGRMIVNGGSAGTGIRVCTSATCTPASSIYVTQYGPFDWYSTEIHALNRGFQVFGKYPDVPGQEETFRVQVGNWVKTFTVRAQ